MGRCLYGCAPETPSASLFWSEWREKVSIKDNFRLDRPNLPNVFAGEMILQSFDDALTKEIERQAVELARGAGRILVDHFGRQITVEFKDKKERDPVTQADKACQEYLAAEITKRFPDHGILGEETASKEEQESEAPARDILWVLDPLDGTTNFMNGLPVFASSIGVLYRGRPIAGALYVPWPTGSGGFVLHCSKGNGCFADDEPVSVYETQEPVPNRLIGVPGYFGVANRFSKRLADKAGEPRTTGSIAYELAMTGALAVAEAGGTVMTRFRGDKQWRPLDSLVPSWDEKTPTMKELRGMTAPLVAGNKHLAPLVANNVRSRFSLKAKLRPLVRVVRSRGGQSRK